MRFDSLSVQCSSKTLVPPIARQARRLDHKPETATPATPQDQVRSPKRHFVIHYSLLHIFCPILIGAYLYCMMGARRLTKPLFLSKGTLVQRLSAVHISLRKSIGFPKRHFGVERSTLCRALVGGTRGPALESND
jgi:hypothetical protein